MNRRERRAERARKRKQATGYLRRMLMAQWDLPPGIHHVTVAHDTGCGSFEGNGCTCTPDIHRRALGSDVVETLEADGTITKTRAS